MTLLIFTGANMPTTNEAVDYLKTKVDIYIPAKAANAGGVATSALEMAQNSARLFWTSEEVTVIKRDWTLLLSKTNFGNKNIKLT